MDFLDELVNELQYHAVALFLFALDHHYVAVFEQQCSTPTDRLNLSLILVNKPALQMFFLGLLSEFGVWQPCYVPVQYQ